MFNIIFFFFLYFFKKKKKKKSLETSNCYFFVGVFYLQHKYYIKALASFKRSLNIRICKFKENNESVADCKYNIGIIYK